LFFHPAFLLSACGFGLKADLGTVSTSDALISIPTVNSEELTMTVLTKSKTK